ncbi:YdcH family protein [Rhodobacter ferrooxidans]|uniref:DUF465 domain-containing protein n=1 Tax=Rhodobacter ferrooxidans TaxID=371731 RepID=C8S1G8_9RHOB|nr:DUF465 domain-containing protein [Rhodobacter sp. SW2]EEW25141.1 conserved hypothetical protein [Rhodobacter sp. SW2]
MSHIPHDLVDDFPAEAARIHALKEKDSQFAKLMAEYAAVNEKVFRAESLLEPTATDHEHDLRKLRLRLKDQIWAALRAA